MAKTTIQNIVRKHLELFAYKIKLKHEIKPADMLRRIDFAIQILSNIDDDEKYLNNILFSYEATIHIIAITVIYGENINQMMFSNTPVIHQRLTFGVDL